MRIGPLEIILILIIIIGIALVTRISRAKPGDAAKSKEPAAHAAYSQAKGRPGRVRNYLIRLGVAFVVAGILSALAGISMLRWAVQGYLWAFIAIVLGFALLFMSRRR